MNYIDLFSQKTRCKEQKLRKAGYRDIAKKAIAYENLDKALKVMNKIDSDICVCDRELIHKRAILYRRQKNKIWRDYSI